MNLRLIFAFAALFFGAIAAQAQSPVTSVVTFTHTHDTGFGNDLFVLGDHPDLGSNVPERAVKLTYTAGNVWTGKVALEAGASVTYRFISRSTVRTAYCNYGTFTAVTTLQTLTVPGIGVVAPYRGKVVWYRSTWNRAFLLYRNNTTGAGFQDLEMRRVGAGRFPGENLFRLDLPQERIASEIEFVFHNELNQYDNAPAPPNNPPQGSAPGVPYPYQSLAPPYNYRTPLDHLFVQDGGVYNYVPPASVGAPRQETRTVSSSYPGIPGRTIRIHLPRGYDANSTRRYPVIYFHDGQNLYFPGGAFGTWDADRIANFETGHGRMRESILVGIDNTANRLGEYCPPTDRVPNSPLVFGQADQYRLFLLNNVIPTITANYRTLTAPGGAVDPAETTIAGSSMGGLVSSYLAALSPDYFRRAGVFSPSFWAAPNHVAFLDAAPKAALKWWLSMGTDEVGLVSDPDIYWNGALHAFNAWLTQGYAHGTELRYAPGCGSVHNEPAWSRLLPAFFQWHASVWDERNALATGESNAGLRVNATVVGGASQLAITALRGVPYALERSTSLANGPWVPAGSGSQREQAWAPLVLVDPTTPAAIDVFWRVTAP